MTPGFYEIKYTEKYPKIITFDVWKLREISRQIVGNSDATCKSFWFKCDLSLFWFYFFLLGDYAYI